MLRSEAAPAFRDAIAQAYHARYGITPAVYPCDPSDGAEEV
jgi:hypothetical protein